MPIYIARYMRLRRRFRECEPEPCIGDARCVRARGRNKPDARPRRLANGWLLLRKPDAMSGYAIQRSLARRQSRPSDKPRSIGQATRLARLIGPVLFFCALHHPRSSRGENCPILRTGFPIHSVPEGTGESRTGSGAGVRARRRPTFAAAAVYSCSPAICLSNPLPYPITSNPSLSRSFGIPVSREKMSFRTFHPTLQDDVVLEGLAQRVAGRRQSISSPRSASSARPCAASASTSPANCTTGSSNR